MTNWIQTLDGPTVVLAITQILAAVLGAVMATFPDFVLLHRWRFLAAVVLLAIVGVISTLVQSSRSASSSAALQSTLGSLSRSTEETSRLTARNNALQGELVRSTQKITDLGNETVELATTNTELTRESIRQVTGEGGYSVVVPYYMSIDPAIVAKEKIVIPHVIPTMFGVLNN